MQRTEYQTIGDVLRDTVQQCGMQERLDEFRAASLWPAVAGEHLAALTGRAFVKASVMSVPVADAALRQELTMNRSRLRKAINELMGKEVISEIRFTGA